MAVGCGGDRQMCEVDWYRYACISSSGSRAAVLWMASVTAAWANEKRIDVRKVAAPSRCGVCSVGCCGCSTAVQDQVHIKKCATDGWCSVCDVLEYWCSVEYCGEV